MDGGLIKEDKMQDNMCENKGQKRWVNKKEVVKVDYRRKLHLWICGCERREGFNGIVNEGN